MPPGILELASPRQTLVERPRPEQTTEQQRQLWARDREFRTGVGARMLHVRGRIGTTREPEDVADLLTPAEWLRARITWWAEEVHYQRPGWELVIHALEIGEEVTEPEAPAVEGEAKAT